MATIKKMPSGSWSVKVFDYTDENGKRIIRTFTSPVKTEVEIWLKEFELEKKLRRREGRSPIKKTEDLTVGELLDRYIENSPFLSPTTLDGYRKIRANNFRELMALPAGQLSAERIQQEINKEARLISPRTGRLLSAKTIKNNWAAVAAALKTELGAVYSVKLPKVRPNTSVLPEPEAVMAAIRGTPCELPCLLAMWLSFSMSEIRGLRCSDVDLERMTISINQVMVDAEGLEIIKPLAKTPTRLRTTELPQLLANMIRELDTWREYRATGEDRLLIDRSRKSIIHYYTKAVKAAGLDITFHDLRHIFASTMLNKLGMPSKLVQLEGGWSTPAVMDRVYSQAFSSSQQQLHRERDAYFQQLYAGNLTKNSTECR